jgi:hypothetical protein
MAPERERYIFNGSGIRNTEKRPTDILRRRERGMGIKKAGRIVAAALALQAPLQALAYEKISTDKSTAIVASAGAHYSSIPQQVTYEPASPPPSAIISSTQHEVPPAAKPKQVESPKCNNGWEQLRKGVCLAKFREYGSDLYVVRADLKDPKVSVRPAFVAGPGRLGRLKYSAQKQDAIAAINASFFQGGRALGPIAFDGNWIYTDPSPQQVLIVNKDNTVKIIPTEQALTKDPTQMKFALSGSHVLVQNGIPIADFGPDNKECFLNCKQPRSAIGVDAEGYFYMVVVDGRSRKSSGMTVPELSGVMGEMGVSDGALVDGGGSTRLYAKGEIYNNPSSDSRKISIGVFVTAN